MAIQAAEIKNNFSFNFRAPGVPIVFLLIRDNSQYVCIVSKFQMCGL